MMWPIVVAGLVAVAVVGERAWWWWTESRKRSPETLEKVFAALENGDMPEATRLSSKSGDPVVCMVYHGLTHFHSSMQGALQVAAGVELQKAGRFLTVMDTLVTLGPLLGLLGTVSGIFRTFLSLGGATVEGATSQITGGIGEALIATMYGLGIAIFALIPFNYFTRKVAQLHFELETAATNVEVLTAAGAKKNLRPPEGS